jgi:hypothetical protein
MCIYFFALKVLVLPLLAMDTGRFTTLPYRGSQNCAFAPVAIKERILVPPGYAVAFPHDLTFRP